MATKKKEPTVAEETLVAETPELEFAALRDRGYDPDAARRYAAAAKSWEPKGSPVRKLWEDVEKLATGALSGSKG